MGTRGWSLFMSRHCFGFLSYRLVAGIWGHFWELLSWLRLAPCLLSSAAGSVAGPESCTLWPWALPGISGSGRGLGGPLHAKQCYKSTFITGGNGCGIRLLLPILLTLLILLRLLVRCLTDWVFHGDFIWLSVGDGTYYHYYYYNYHATPGTS